MQVFPTIPGITWPASRRPTYSNVLQQGVTGKRTAVRLQFEPRWSYELEVEFLRSAGSTEFLDLLNLYLNCCGQAFPFLFNDLGDNGVINQQIGTGDGTTRTFFLQRTLAGFNQRIAALNGTPTITIAGSPASATIDAYGKVTFSVAPGAGQVVAWSGSYYWICRFAEDQLDLSQFASNWWQVKSLKFDTELIVG
jgi:hypothetical protein